MAGSSEHTSFGSRLRQERRRVGLSQVQFAELGGVKRVSQHLYEQDVRLPDLGYVFRLADQGIDAEFLVFGQAARGSVGAQISLEAAAAAFRAMEELGTKRRASLTSSERERLFASLCLSLAANPSAPPSLSSSVPQTRQVRRK